MLIKSTKKEAFEKNAKTELKEGKGKKQSLAIAYSEQREAMKRKMKEDKD